MGSFLEHPVCRLVPGPPGAYSHWFGGPPTHKGAIPPGREHPVNLLYDLDLADPALGLASRFPGLSPCRCTTRCNTTAWSWCLALS